MTEVLKKTKDGKEEERLKFLQKLTSVKTWRR